MKKLLLLLMIVPMMGFGQQTGCISGDCKNGTGTYIIDTGWCEGFKYEGEFKDGKFHGQGTCTRDNLMTYVGQWKDNVFNGNGKSILGPIEDPLVVYVGKFKDGDPSGKFKCVATCNDDESYFYDRFNWTYVGEIIGYNMIYVFNGHGTWIAGEGKYKGDKYVGEWKDAKKYGQGTYTFANGDKYVGEWKDDEKDGQGKMTYDDGTVKEGLWENGEFIGK
jgi:hypothetical protein